jgi:hypothetical protein
MLRKVESTIYLSSLRGCTQDENFRSYHIFNYGSYVNEFRKGFGSVKVCNDETLRAKCQTTHHAQPGMVVILLPIVGALHLKTEEKDWLVDAGHAFAFRTAKEIAYQVSNPFETELINYLLFVVEEEGSPFAELFGFDLDLSKGNLVQLGKRIEWPTAFIGKYDGRQEGTFDTSGHDVFVFVMEGAFEVQNRLLQPRDGLALRNCDEVEFEALSNEAILLLVQLKY